MDPLSVVEPFSLPLISESTMSPTSWLLTGVLSEPLLKVHVRENLPSLQCESVSSPLFLSTPTLHLS